MIPQNRVEQHHQQQDDETNHPSYSLRKRMIVRLNAYCLPRWGVRRRLPDTYAVLRTRLENQAVEDEPLDRPLQLQRQQSHQGHNNGQAIQHRKTEIVFKNSSPQWTTSFPIEYTLGSQSSLYVGVYRVPHKATTSDTSTNAGEENNNNEKPDILLGNAIFDIGDVLGSFNNVKCKRFPSGGVVYCQVEPIPDLDAENRICRFQFAGRGLSVHHKAMKGRGLGLVPSRFPTAPDTIVQISKRHLRGSGQPSWDVVYRSQPVADSWNPTWDVGELDFLSLCSGESACPLRISVWTCCNSSGGDRSPSSSSFTVNGETSALGSMLGECETTWDGIVAHFRRNPEDAWFPLHQSVQEQNSKFGRLVIKAANVLDRSSSDDVGGRKNESESPLWETSRLMASHKDTIEEESLTINIASLPSPVRAPVTFQEYMESWGLELTIAIDFTSSNGDPRIPGSLHDRNPTSFNDYEESMVSIASAIAPYTKDTLLDTTLWGFGCRSEGEVRHLFQCGSHAKYQGVFGILEGYREVLDGELNMSGPTCYDEVLEAAAFYAYRNRQQGNQVYSVLLIITDGICQNMEDAKQRLQRYSEAPLSVIFVGVGRQDFTAMEDLVACTTPGVRSNSAFVEFRKHQYDPTALGRQALQNLPSQLVEYMLKNNYMPLSKANSD